MDEPRSETAAADRKHLAYGAYAIALLIAAVSSIGPRGILLGSLILLAWGFVFFNLRRPRALLLVVLFAVAIVLLLICSIPAYALANETARRTQCRNNLKQIGLALHNYHDDFGSFPPAYTVGADGRPLHSWRVLILPFVDQVRLYEQFHLDEPWDSPHNSEVTKSLRYVPQVFACPSRAPEDVGHEGRTSYVAVVGEGTIWPGGGRATKISDVEDGTSRTILLIESHSEIPWTEPRDLSFEEALDQLTASPPDVPHDHRSQGVLYDDFYGRSVLIADGGVRFAGEGVGRGKWSELLLMDDDRPETGWSATGDSIGVTRIPQNGNWIRLIIFLIVALFPLPWVWLNPTSGRDDRTTDNPA